MTELADVRLVVVQRSHPVPFIPYTGPEACVCGMYQGKDSAFGPCPYCVSFLASKGKALTVKEQRGAPRTRAEAKAEALSEFDTMAAKVRAPIKRKRRSKLEMAAYRAEREVRKESLIPDWLKENEAYEQELLDNMSDEIA